MYVITNMNNHIFKTVFNRSLGIFQVVGENAKGHGASGSVKRVRKMAALLFSLAGFSFAAFAQNLPTGGNIVSGNGNIHTPNALQMRVEQNSEKLIVNWQSFNIGKEAAVNFQQPSASAIALNRVLGSDGSRILGRLEANGRVFLVNPNGVLFGKNAQVNTAGLVASTLNIKDEDFLQGNYRFSGNGGEIINEGNLSVSEGGSVALLGGKVLNNGIIIAKLGNVALASGKSITLDFAGDGLLNVEISEGLKDALVKNGQLIIADGGQVILSAKAAETLVENLVNNEGIIRAQTVGEREGKIVLLGTGGITEVAGTLDASAPEGGNGGFIETSGDVVNIADSVNITTQAPNGSTGLWLVDPEYFVIGTGSNDNVSGETVTNTLKTTDFVAEADKDVIVNDAINWSANTLTLTAGENIKVNNALTATDNAKLVVNHGAGTDADGVPYGLYTAQGARSFLGQINLEKTVAVTINGQTYTVLTDADTEGLENFVNGAGQGHYVLGSDIVSNFFENKQIDTFSGSLNGLGHTIKHRNTTGGGLFGALTTGGIVSNLGRTDSINGDSVSTVKNVGALANVNQGTLVNNFSTASVGSNLEIYTFSTVDGESYIGGLVGVNKGLIAQCSASGTVHGVMVAGGLVGLNEGKIIDSFVPLGSNQVSISKTSNNISHVGGLVGINRGEIKRAWTANFLATASGTYASIFPDFKGGGFVGLNDTGATIEESYAYRDGSTTTATATSIDNIAGFVYENKGEISNAYAHDTLSGNRGTSAGFVQINSGTIENAYARYQTTISANPQRHGFARENNGTLTNAYWSYESLLNSIVPEPLNIAGATQLDNSAANQLASYAGFDSDVWGGAGTGFPMLKNLATVYVGNYATLTYGKAPLSGTTLVVSGLQAGDSRANFLTLDPAALENGYLNAGTHKAAEVLAPNTPGLYSIQGQFVVTPATLKLPTTVGAMVADKVYDGSTEAQLKDGLLNGGATGAINGQTLKVSYDVAFDDANAGTATANNYRKPVTFSNITLEDGDGPNAGLASNYSIAATASGYGRIMPLPLDADAFALAASNKVYDASTTAQVALAAANSVLLADIDAGKVGLAHGAANFDSARAGADKTVTVTGLALSGAGAGNYSVASGTLTAQANITPRPLTVTGSVPEATATGPLAAAQLGLSGILGGDTVNLTGSATIAGTAQLGSNPLDISQLAIDNPDYTLAGGSLIVAGATQYGRIALAKSDGVSFDAEQDPLEITIASNKARIDWNKFGIGSAETVTFTFGDNIDTPQPQSIVLNRVLGGEASVIAGALKSNGRVFLLNPHGVLFAAGSSVDVAALLASTHTLDVDKFDAGNYLFAVAQGDGEILNAGDIVVADGGFIALASQKAVEQTDTGTLTAPGGTVLLAAAGNGFALEVDAQTPALAGYGLASLQGTVTAAGAMDVSGGGSAAAGRIALAGQTLAVDADQLTTGSGDNVGTLELALPAIAIGGGAGDIAQTSGNLGADFVAGQLAERNLALQTADGGGIALDADVTWAANTHLALLADGAVDFNARLAATGTNAALSLSGNYAIHNAGYDAWNQQATGHAGAGITLGGANARLTIDGQAYTLLRTLEDLRATDVATAGSGRRPLRAGR